MGWNGAGSIVWPYDWTDDAGNSVPITASRFDGQWDDAASTIEACLNRNGENAMAANLNMGTSYHLTNLAAGSDATDSITMRQVADNSVQYGGTTSGSSNAYTLTDAVMSTTSQAGMRLLLLANHTNTGAATFALNSDASPIAIVRSDGSTALKAGEIVSGDFFEIAFDGTSWVLVHSPLSQTGDFVDGLISVGIDDTIAGNLYLYGGATATSEFRQYTDSSVSSSINYWKQVTNTTTGDWLFQDNSNSTYIQAVEAYGVRLAVTDGSVSFGVDGSVPALLEVFGGANTEEGGRLHLYNAADHDTNTEYFEIGPNSSGDLKIGRTTNDDIVIDEDTGDVTIANDVIVTGATTISGALTLSSDTAAVVKGAEQAASDDDGTKSTGTYTPDPDGGNIKHIINGGAFTLAPPSQICTMVIQMTNNGTAGAVTTSGFSLVDGDSLTTTDTHVFLLYITITESQSYLNIKAMQ